MLILPPRGLRGPLLRSREYPAFWAQSRPSLPIQPGSSGISNPFPDHCTGPHSCLLACTPGAWPCPLGLSLGCTKIPTPTPRVPNIRYQCQPWLHLPNPTKPFGPELEQPSPEWPALCPSQGGRLSSLQHPGDGKQQGGWVGRRGGGLAQGRVSQASDALSSWHQLCSARSPHG